MRERGQRGPLLENAERRVVYRLESNALSVARARFAALLGIPLCKYLSVNVNRDLSSGITISDNQILIFLSRQGTCDSLDFKICYI